jgi:hypothetical protein
MIWRCHSEGPFGSLLSLVEGVLGRGLGGSSFRVTPGPGRASRDRPRAYCTTRQWPLPKEQVDVIDAFFAAKHAAGMVRESKSPHSSPTFCVRKPNGKWHMVHAFNKLNAATIPASTPIPRKDVLQNNMAGCTVFSALDVVDGYYQLLMRESDIPITAVSTPRDVVGMAGDAPGAVQRSGDVQSLSDTTIPAAAALCANLLRRYLRSQPR